VFRRFKLHRKNEALKCSFCNRKSDEIEKLIASPSNGPIQAYLCNECVIVCSAILESEKKMAAK